LNLSTPGVTAVTFMDMLTRARKRYRLEKLKVNLKKA